MNRIIKTDSFGQFNYRLTRTRISNLFCTFILVNSIETSYFVHEATAHQKLDGYIASTIPVTLHILLETGPDNRQSQHNRHISQ